MATCAVAVQQADGSYSLSLDPLVTDVTTCTYVVQSGSDLGNSLLTLSVLNGSVISGAMVLVWVAAWGIRQVWDLLHDSTREI